MKINLIIGAIISALAIYYLATKIDASELIATFKTINLLYIIPIVLINFAAIWVRSLRWKYLLGSVGEVRMKNLFYAILAGYMVNMLLPGRLGEFLRAHVVGERERINKLSSFATIVVERLVDCFSVVAILLGVVIVFLLGYADEMGAIVPRLKYYGLVAAAILIGFLILLLLFQKKRDWALKFIAPLIRILPKGAGQRFEGMVDSFIDGLDSLKMGKNLALVILISVPVWLISVVSNYLIIKAFGLSLPIYGYFFLIVTQALGVIIPTPGYIGTYHLTTRSGLVWLGVAEAKAQSIAIVAHASFFIPLVVGGLIYWWIGGLSLKEISKNSPLEPTP